MACCSVIDFTGLPGSGDQADPWAEVYVQNCFDRESGASDDHYYHLVLLAENDYPGYKT